MIFALCCILILIFSFLLKALKVSEIFFATLDEATVASRVLLDRQASDHQKEKAARKAAIQCTQAFLSVTFRTALALIIPFLIIVSIDHFQVFSIESILDELLSIPVIVLGLASMLFVMMRSGKSNG